jgi:hypothetical protein
MIPYEDLAAALEAYAARVHGRAPAGGGARPLASPGAVAASRFEEPPAIDAPLDEPQAMTAAAGGYSMYEGGEDHTQVGSMPGSADPSQEIDIGDVVSDEPPEG